MALTREQFMELRQKGLSVQQIRDFEAGKAPEAPATEPEPDRSTFGARFKQDILTPAVGVIDSIAKPGRTIQRGLAGVSNKLFGTDIQVASNEEAKQTLNETTGIDLNSTQGKIGSFVGDVGVYAAPTNLAGKATAGVGAAKTGLGIAARFLGKNAARGAAGAATAGLQSGELGRGELLAGGLEAAAGPAGRVLSKTYNFSKSVIRNAAAGISGKGSDVIETILKNPKAAREGLREVISRADDAAKIRQSVSNLSREASKQFGEALDNLPKRLGRKPNVVTAGGTTTIKVDGKKYTLSLRGLKSQLTKTLRDFDVAVDPRKKKFDFSEAPLDAAESKRLSEVFDVIDNWKDTTPRGFHKLSRKIAGYRRPGEQSPELNSIIDRLSTRAHTYIASRIPAAKDMLNDYRQAQDIINVFDKEFATKGSFVGGTADRIATEKKLGTLFSGEKTTGREFLEAAVPGGSDIPAREAGRLLSQDITRSGASIGDLLRTAVNTVISPKTVGELTAATGIAAPKIERFLSQAQALEPAARATFVQAFVDLLEDEPPQQGNTVQSQQQAE